MNYWKVIFVFSYKLFIAISLFAQDLDPRAYARVPVNLTTLVTGFSYSYGGVVTDATLPIQDIKADIQTPSIAVAHSFGFLKRTSQVHVAVPFSWAQVSGLVGDSSRSISRTGFSDMRVRFSMLLFGAPAATLLELKNAHRKTVLGISINMVVPTGQFYPDKLINLGTNRFSVKPEIALSQPLGKRFLIDVYAGIWIFTDNNSFYPGNSVRAQDPMTTFQTHLSYNISPLMWVALNATYYVGGTSSINNIYNDDRQSNSRIGATTVMPIGKKSSLKFSISRGAIVRVGQNFNSVSIGWQTSWIGKTSKANTSKPN